MRFAVPLLLAVCFAIDGHTPAAADDAAARPNVIVILADDLGYADIGVHGGTQIPTPNIDRLAASGVRCTDGYVSCPYCSPTRAGLLTGRYQQRFGHEFNCNPANKRWREIGLPTTETTIADRLAAAGYATGMVGKSHLGYADAYHPLRRGFQEFFGHLAGGHAYFSTSKPFSKNSPLLRGTTPVAETEYLTDALAREAVSFVERHRERPFFLYLAFNAVHTPMEAKPEQLARFAAIADEERRTYAAMTVSLDEAVGRVLDALEAAGVRERTLVFFLSDNGGPTCTDMAKNGSLNTPLRGSKGQTLEGGIRVPFLVSWPGKLPAGTTYGRPVIQLDILPTALAAAGAPVAAEAALDGVDLVPYLSGRRDGPPHEALYWRFGRQSAIRKGNLKLVTWMDRDTEVMSTQLFDLAADVGEAHDLAADRPADVAALTADWRAWNATLAEPLWLDRTKDAAVDAK
jgi:arylsulfatase A-like enzyme